jgi:hypothetical protein
MTVPRLPMDRERQEFNSFPLPISRSPALPAVDVANYAPSTNQTVEVPVAGHNSMLKRRRTKNYALKQLAKAKKAAKKARNQAKKK